MSWPVVRVGDVLTIDRKSVQPEAIADGTTYVGLESIGRGGQIDETVVISSGQLKSAKMAFDSRHVLFGKLRPNLGKVARPSVPGVCSTDIFPLLPGPRLDRGYLAFHLLRPESIAEAARRTAGANLPRIDSSGVLSMEIPLPPLPEQRRIAAILDQADELRTKRRRSVDLLRRLEEEVFLEMFGDEPVGATLGDVLAPGAGSMRTGPFGSDLLHSEFVEAGVPVLGIDNVVSNEFEWAKPRFITEEKYSKLKRYTVEPRDVLVSIMGTVGRCAVVPSDIGIAINTKHLCCITVNRSECLPEYLHAYFLMHPAAKRYLGRSSKGAIMAGLNMSIIRSMPMSIPSLKRQEDYVATVTGIAAQRDSTGGGGQRLDALFASLQHRAFAGQL